MTLPPDPTVSLRLRLFGPFAVQVNGAPLPRLRSRKVQSLLALLTLRADTAVERPWLTGLLWPDSPEGTALATLRGDLVNLRRALGPAAARLRSPTPRSLCLELATGEADVLAFDAALRLGDPASLEAAVALYGGVLLEGWAEEWVFQERQAREQAYLAARERLAALAFERGETAEAERHLRQAVAVDPLRESAQRALMQVLAAGGNYAAALLCYRELRQHLHRELNTEPDAETQTVFQQLRSEAREKADARWHTPTAGVPAGASKAGGNAFQPPLTLSELASAGTPAVGVCRLASGTVTFLFTDIEGSTRLWEQHPEAMRDALARHDTLLRQAIETHRGHVFKTVGDQFCAAFATAPAALATACDAQRAVQAEAWEEIGPLRVRMALHTGAAQERDGDYFGPPLNRVARLLEAGHGGQILLSLATQELSQDRLPPDVSLRDLGEHRFKDLARPEHVFQLVDPQLPSDFPPLRSLGVLPNNLPQQVTPFIGREREMREVKELLARTRLLTLTGSGGTGKTRLSLQVAADWLERYPDGVWLVELAALFNPELVPQAAAAVLGVKEGPGRPLLQTLVDSQRPKRLLLVLDNCEHLLTACALLADALIQGCPHLSILASSREGLNIAGEITYHLPSLASPDPQRLPSLEELTRYEAVCFFIDRACAVAPSFAVTRENALAVAQVCHRLDGIPLAIELAATRIKALPVEKLADRLDDRFRLLTGGSRVALPRQQTLRATIDWSYDLLSPPERVLLRRLAVFAGGWTLEAAEAVCSGVQAVGRSGVQVWEDRSDRTGPTRTSERLNAERLNARTLERLNADDVLDLLTGLVSKSLVLYEEQGGQERYRFLETVRQYARDQLAEVGEAQALRAQHVRYYLALAETGRGAAWPPRPDGTEWRFAEVEEDNFRTALEWCKAHCEAADPSPEAQAPPEAAQGLRLILALWWPWFLRSQIRETRAYLKFFLSVASEAAVGARVRALALNGVGFLAYLQGEYEEARIYLEQGLALAESLPGQTLGNVLYNLANVMTNLGDYARSRHLQQRALALRRESGHRWGVGWSLIGLAELARRDGSYGEAAESQEESLRLFRELDDQGAMAGALNELGRTCLASGDLASARRHLTESLRLRRARADQIAVSDSLETLAGLCLHERQGEQAAQLLGAAERLRRATGGALFRIAAEEHQRVVAALREVLGDERFARLWADGQAMTLDEAIAAALEGDAAS